MPLRPPPKTSLPAFTPPPRFGKTDFGSYKPQHPSQEVALEKVQAFAREVAQPAKSPRSWPWVKRENPQGRGLYLDGGFGVGKTHLLAAAFHACGVQKKAYLSFQDLVYVVGVQGVMAAKRELGDTQLFCIDEFELDDPGNTLIVKSFLAHVFAQGGSVMTTSNTPPEAQGQGRFNADDFKREIQSVAERFTVVSLQGPDYRHRERLAELLSDGELERRFNCEQAAEPKEMLTWAALLEALGRRSPGALRRAYRPVRHALCSRRRNTSKPERRAAFCAFYRQALRPEQRVAALGQRCAGRPL